ncbi:MAG: tetratricopeptide repeat protein, partial [Gammaproteobacteria bacterium]|nr:tetratricopeptide repeat protein [Gammaproteobacteria bacterium]
HYKAEAYLAIGQYYRATTQLETALGLTKSFANEQLAAQLAASLGTAYLLTNRNEEARELLEKAVKGEQANGRLASAAVAGNNLGNLHASQGEYKAAISAYRQATVDAKAAENSELTAKLSVNIARALLDSGRDKEALESLKQVSKQAASLSASHEKAYVLIGVGRLYSRLAGSSNTPARLEKLAQQTLKSAAVVAQSINDDRAMSYAYGYLGELYEHAGRAEEARLSTQKALHHLRAITAPEMRYRWQWLQARLLKASGDIDLAINAYRRAVDDLQTVRPVLASGQTGQGGDFRQQAGQLYPDLADLLLKKADATTAGQSIEVELLEARNAIEMLKGAELEN